MKAKELNRRAFFMRTGVSVGGAALLYRCHQPGETWSYLTDGEAAVLEAVLGRIIPGDEDPGAREAGVVYFIDRQLVGPYQRYQERYRKGLKNLEQTSRTVYGRAFTALSAEEQDGVLGRLERNEVDRDDWPDGSPPAFFSMVVDHTMQGFYGSPIHGGNQGFASYKMLGIALPIDYEGEES